MEKVLPRIWIGEQLRRVVALRVARPKADTVRAKGNAAHQMQNKREDDEDQECPAGRFPLLPRDHDDFSVPLLPLNPLSPLQTVAHVLFQSFCFYTLSAWFQGTAALVLARLLEGLPFL